MASGDAHAAMERNLLALWKKRRPRYNIIKTVLIPVAVVQANLKFQYNHESQEPGYRGLTREWGMETGEQ